jgi:hypothetical protein
MGVRDGRDLSKHQTFSLLPILSIPTQIDDLALSQEYQNRSSSIW